MSTSNEVVAMRLALEALEDIKDDCSGCEFEWSNDYPLQAKAKLVLEIALSEREALAKSRSDVKQEQSTECVGEPVLIVEKEPDYMSNGHFHSGRKPYIDPTKVWRMPIGTKLYTTPQPKQEPVAEPHKGEPVAWLDPWTKNNVTTDYDAYGEHGIPLYTTPYSGQQRIAKRKPLTDEQIEQAENQIWNTDQLDEVERQANKEFVRAIEAAHGITKEKNT